jgi:hypothetical protein
MLLLFSSMLKLAAVLFFAVLQIFRKVSLAQLLLLSRVVEVFLFVEDEFLLWAGPYRMGGLSLSQRISFCVWTHDLALLKLSFVRFSLHRVEVLHFLELLLSQGEQLLFSVGFGWGGVEGVRDVDATTVVDGRAFMFAKDALELGTGFWFAEILGGFGVVFARQVHFVQNSGLAPHVLSVGEGDVLDDSAVFGLGRVRSGQLGGK